MISKDRYASQGGTVHIVNSEHMAVVLVSEHFNCRVWLEGSTGPERTIWTDLADGIWGEAPSSKRVVLGHTWPTAKGWKVRIFERPME
jgi:hypothetical protein